MKAKNLIYSAMILLSLAACNKEADHYESKNVKVDSVFDKVEDAKDSNDTNNQADKKENQDNQQASNNQNQEKNKDQNGNNDQAKEEDKKNPNENNKDNNANNSNNKKKYKATSSLNLRTDPNTNADNIITAIDLGTEFEALEELEANGKAWVKLEYQGKTGYVVKDLLQEVNN